jgi:hypothetical protein
LIFLAHGIGGVRDLPVPTWLFYWGGAVVLVLSFVALGALWQTPQLARHAQGRSLGRALGAVVLSRPLTVAVQALSVALFVVVFAAALLGTTREFENLAPTWIYVVFWLGLPLLSALLGDVWRVLSPWRAIADGAVWAWERTGRDAHPLAAYPERAGRWPAALVLLAFTALELTYSDPASPRALAFAIALYTYVALFGMAAFGRETWTVRGEGFAVLFHYFSRLSPLAVSGRAVHLRVPFTGLAGAERVPGSLAFVAVMLGSVGFDGYSRTSAWQDLVARVERPYVIERPQLGDLLVNGVNLAGLLLVIVLVALAYLGACALARSLVGAPRSLVPEFLLGLIPIAFVYEVAHYFSLFLIQGQYAIPLLSDPLGRGWDLFGSADFTPNLAPVSPNTVWYVQAGALVAGHVAGLSVAHDRAVTIFEDRQDALRSQYAFLALMVVYTIGGLWLLSRS